MDLREPACSQLLRTHISIGHLPPTGLQSSPVCRRPSGAPLPRWRSAAVGRQYASCLFYLHDAPHSKYGTGLEPPWRLHISPSPTKKEEPVRLYRDDYQYYSHLPCPLWKSSAIKIYTNCPNRDRRYATCSRNSLALQPACLASHRPANGTSLQGSLFGPLTGSVCPCFRHIYSAA